MTSRPFRWLALGAGLCVLPLFAAEDRPPPQVVSAPAKNWVWPRFTKEGFRWMTLRGTEVREISPTQIDIVDLNITVYSRDAAAQIESIILSPAASYFTRENRVSGAQSVRMIDYQHAMEVTGEQWTVELDTKKISIGHNGRVVIHSALPDLLK
jgi:hypothetical protein